MEPPQMPRPIAAGTIKDAHARKGGGEEQERMKQKQKHKTKNKKTRVYGGNCFELHWGAKGRSDNNGATGRKKL